MSALITLSRRASRPPARRAAAAAAALCLLVALFAPVATATSRHRPATPMRVAVGMSGMTDAAMWVPHATKHSTFTVPLSQARSSMKTNSSLLLTLSHVGGKAWQQHLCTKNKCSMNAKVC